MWMWTWWLKKMVEKLPSFGHHKVTIPKPFLNNLTLGQTNNLHPSSWLLFEWDPLKDLSNIIISTDVWGLYYEIQLHRCNRAWPMPNSVPRFHGWMTQGVGPQALVANLPTCCIVLSQTCRKEQSFPCSKWLSAHNLWNCCIAPSHTCLKEQSFLCSKWLSARKLCNCCIVPSHTCWKEKSFLCSKRLSARNLWNCCVVPSHTCQNEKSFFCSKMVNRHEDYPSPISHNVVELLWGSLLTFWGINKKKKA